MSIVGVLAVYYGGFAQRAIDEFEVLLRPIDAAAKIVVVDNSRCAAGTAMLSASTCIIGGDNRLREFSAWNKGLAHLRANDCLTNTLAVVLANDTFCHNNRYGPITRFAFRRAITAASDSHHPISISGERHGLGCTFGVAGMGADRWISTYLFVLQSKLLDDDDLIPDRFVAATPSTLSDLYDIWQASPNLRQHVSQWLGFEGNNRTRWYKADSLGAPNSAEAIQKAACILAEKYIAAKCEKSGGQVIDVFGSRLIRMLRRLDRREH